MNYGPGFDELGISVLAVFITYAFLQWLQKLDDKRIVENENEEREAIFSIRNICHCLLAAEITCIIAPIGMARNGCIGRENAIIIFLAAFAGCLVAACVMDIKSCMIYNYVWLVAVVAAMMLLCLGNRTYLWELVGYVLIQETVCGKLYGRADCHAFAVCALTECAWGMPMEAYWLHMLCAFILLAFVQGARGNIGKKGVLKKPVAFLPYITVSFWLLLCFYG